MHVDDRGTPDDEFADFSDAFSGFTTSDDKKDDDDAGDDDAGDPPVDPPADDDASDDVDDAGDDDSGDDDEGDDDADDNVNDGAGDDDDDDAGDDDDDAGDDDTPPEPKSKSAKSSEADDDDLLKRLRSMLKDDDAGDDDADDSPTQQQPQDQDLPPIYTDEEAQQLKDYEEEWPDVAKGEALRRRAEYRELMGYVFQEIGKHLQPIVQTVDTLAVRAQYTDITQSNPDYEEIRDGVVDWVEQQPAYLQDAYKQVMQQGTAEEVSDLLNRYRESTGGTKKGAGAKPKKQNAEPSETAKKAAKSMAPVSTKRSAVPQGDDPNDFDAAFKKFAGTE